MSELIVAAGAVLLFLPSLVFLVGGMYACGRWYVAQRKLSPAKSIVQSALGPVSLMLPRTHSDDSRRWLKAFYVWAALFVLYSGAVILGVRLLSM